LRCAVEIQRAMTARNAGVPQDRRIEFRIGIHQGDIVVEDGDIFGDGVNVAARLEGLAEAGGICVSARVQEDAAGKLDLVFEDIGEQELKNITRPVRVYRVRAVSTPTALPQPSLPLPDKPSIAVLPFANMSGDPEQEYFADGMVEEITTALSRIRWLFVIARNSSFTYKRRSVDVKQVSRDLGVRYVLEGSVRRASGRVRITAQLIDALTGTHLWADRFDGSLEDVFDLQDQIATRVVGVIEPTLREAEIRRSVRKPTESLDAYDLYLRALAVVFKKETAEGSSEAITFAKRALAIDPSYAPAAAMVGFCRHWRRLRGWGPISEADVAEAVSLARQAVDGGRDDPDALWMGGWALATMAFEHAAGLSAIERALALNPNSASAWLYCGWLHGFANRSGAAIDAFERSIRLSPLDPGRWGCEGGLAFAHLLAGRYEEAVEWADRAVPANPRATFICGCKAAACGYLGRGDEGRECIRRLSEFVSGFTTITGFKRAWEKFCSPGALDIHLNGLRKAGLAVGEGA
jgi:TolB-like protein